MTPTTQRQPVVHAVHIRDRAGDCLVFGPESRGLPENILSSFEENALTIPMRSSHVRSLNLATAAAVAVYEALRQIG